MTHRYQVMYPVDVGHEPGSSDDLEDAGRIYLAVSGASDIYDRQERRYINPEAEIKCVAEAFETWAAQNGSPASPSSQATPEEGTNG